MPQPFYDDDHNQFRALVREFVKREVTPNLDRWEEDASTGRDVWKSAGAHGILGIRIAEDLGGGGMKDYRFRCVIQEELAAVGAASLASGFSINEDIVASYLTTFGTAEQQKEWLPGMAEGSIVTSIAMSEPSAGSDLRAMKTSAVRDGDDWVINGSKTFITSGFSSDLVLVAARTGEVDGRPRLSLILVPTTTDGFVRGRKLRKLGLHAQDTAEIAFDNLRVPTSNLVGEEGRGFHHLTAQLPLERLSIAWRALCAAEAALEWTGRYTSERKAFGQRIIDLQNTRFRLAEMTTEVDITRTFLEQSILAYNDGTFDATLGAKAKWWSTELQNRVVNGCLQLHGGYGYMDEYPISRAYADARVQTIVGGTTEIMKEIIGRDVAARFSS
ncbi:acyl-CoA dehydrogenase [Rhodococcus sp. ACPA4]|uniref:Acyl-[acyl-carrier-protein] dehydrogenase MbtN n=1 Tax=Rhodococcus globerulus TaxID=33008 RepID=A0ABU4C230_RHOGO|nr:MULTISPECIES: acyl-CoA dehydrogenase family protein [Rhodococcus]NRI69985.1 acyl-CoA dehydrogenase [Rhodococcus sp. MS16]MCE4265771.1 acyl-CoA dehydrogenase family protein [Rhodococcus globerulus]MDV6270531.1 acyl-CoA dehydrogenase family protein [Rhodococcus globerulus]MDV8071053.1 acyl-CoA dehydrogenase family protein [Rhodococcus sp. IEGM 1366]PBC42927.1 acyl-CoA dehydrogenase [Rhodococcus sp. ACPA4]